MVSRRAQDAYGSVARGRFSATAPDLAALGVGVPSGIPLGVDRAGRPSRLRLFRPGGAQVSVAGEEWVASMIALRAAAYGAQVVVVTERPAPWQALARGLGEPPVLDVRAPDSRAISRADSRAARLVVNDTGVRPAVAAGLVPGRWTTVVTMRADVPSSSSADLLVLTRIDGLDVAATTRSWQLPEVAGTDLARLGGRDVALVEPGTWTVVTVRPTPTESALFGLPVLG